MSDSRIRKPAAKPGPQKDAAAERQAQWERFWQDVEAILPGAVGPTAVSLVQFSRGQPARCSRRACRMSGSCHFTQVEGQSPKCGDHVVPDAALVMARNYVSFGFFTLRLFFELKRLADESGGVNRLEALYSSKRQC